MLNKLCIVGTGSWGTAASGLVAHKVTKLVMLARSSDIADSITDIHKNPKHLPDYVLPENVSATTDAREALTAAEAIVLALPSKYLRSSLEAISSYIPEDVPILVLTKGIEAKTGYLMADVVADVVGNSERVCALSGPNHAEEICMGKMSAAVCAGKKKEYAELFQKLFVGETFRVYVGKDLIGLEVAAAIKNVIAIACGICAGLGYGDNSLAVVMTRGLAEISRMVSALGGDPISCLGLSGMGDLVATCTSSHSRNRSFGEAFAKGVSLKDYQNMTGMVVEGAEAVRAAYELSIKLGIDAPICAQIFAILYEGKDVQSAVQELEARIPKDEFYGLGIQE